MAVFRPCSSRIPDIVVGRSASLPYHSTGPAPPLCIRGTYVTAGTCRPSGGVRVDLLWSWAPAFIKMAGWQRIRSPSFCLLWPPPCLPAWAGWSSKRSKPTAMPGRTVQPVPWTRRPGSGSATWSGLPGSRLPPGFRPSAHAPGAAPPAWKTARPPAPYDWQKFPSCALCHIRLSVCTL